MPPQRHFFFLPFFFFPPPAPAAFPASAAAVPSAPAGIGVAVPLPPADPVPPAAPVDEGAVNADLAGPGPPKTGFGTETPCILATRERTRASKRLRKTADRALNLRTCSPRRFLGQAPSLVDAATTYRSVVSCSDDQQTDIVSPPDAEPGLHGSCEPSFDQEEETRTDFDRFGFVQRRNGFREGIPIVVVRRHPPDARSRLAVEAESGQLTRRKGSMEEVLARVGSKKAGLKLDRARSSRRLAPSGSPIDFRHQSLHRHRLARCAGVPPATARCSMAIKPLVDAVAIALGAAEVVSRAATISAQRNPLRPPTSRKAEPIRPAEPAPKPRQEPVKDAPSWRKEAWPAGPARHPIDSKTPKDRRPFEASLASQPASAPAPSTSADVVQKSSHTFVSENPAGNEAARTEVKLDVPPLQTRPSSSPVDSLWLSSSPTTEGTSLQPPAPSPASSSDPVASSSKSLDPEAAELIKAVARERFVQDEASRQAETLVRPALRCCTTMCSHLYLQSKPVLRASKVPSSRIGRLFHYGGKPFPDALARLTHADRNIRSSGAGLAAGLGWGMASEAARRSTGAGGSATGSLLLSEANVKRLVAKLSRMRGAALKLGQFMSIQGAAADLEGVRARS